MAQKKGFLGSIFSRQKGGCCDIRIEEIPDQVEEQDKETNYSWRCCTPKPLNGNVGRTQDKKNNEGGCCCCNGPEGE